MGWLWRFYQEGPPPASMLRGDAGHEMIHSRAKRRGFLLKALVAASLLALLVACSSGFRAASYGFDVGISPSPLSFGGGTNDGSAGFTFPEHEISFSSYPGALGVTIKGYEIDFREASGSQLFPGDSVQRNTDGLNIYVPPGLICPSSTALCTINTPGVVFARGQEVSSSSHTLLTEDIARQLDGLVNVGGAVGAYAEIHFYGTDDLQRSFRSDPYRVAIVIE